MLFRLARFCWLPVIVLLAGIAELRAQRFDDEESASFVRSVTEQLTSRQSEILLGQVWWGNADEAARAGLAEAFSEIAKYRIHSVKLRGLMPEDRLLDGSDRSVTTDLPVRAVLSIEIAVTDAKGDAHFLFEYPVGRADGKVWILPVLDRSRR
jgi:hypothetical protein